MDKLSKNLADFLNSNHSRYHVTEYMRKKLLDLGFTELPSLSDAVYFNAAPGAGCFITTNLSSLVAFQNPQDALSGFIVSAAHSDSPCLKVKAGPAITSNGTTRLNVSCYGGMLMSTWFDRPLSLAGKLIYSEENTLKTTLFDIDRDCLIIPSVAAHMSPKANTGLEIKANIDLLPLLSTGEDPNALLKLLADAANVPPESIKGFEAETYVRQPASLWGNNAEFISSGRLDDLQCAFAAFNAFIDAGKNKTHAQVFYLSDSEEVGSGTRQGAASTTLFDVLFTISRMHCGTHDRFTNLLRNSLLLSCDNAHALHPNHPELSDPALRPALNGGPVIKHGTRYTTDAVSEAMVRVIAEHANVPVQHFSNRSDLSGGTTLGNILLSKLSMNAADIGVAQLAMHSSYETAGAQDTTALYSLLVSAYQAHVIEEKDGSYIVDWCSDTDDLYTVDWLKKQINPKNR